MVCISHKLSMLKLTTSEPDTYQNPEARFAKIIETVVTGVVSKSGYVWLGNSFFTNYAVYVYVLD